MEHDHQAMDLAIDHITHPAVKVNTLPRYRYKTTLVILSENKFTNLKLGAIKYKATRGLDKDQAVKSDIIIEAIGGHLI